MNTSSMKPGARIDSNDHERPNKHLDPGPLRAVRNGACSYSTAGAAYNKSQDSKGDGGERGGAIRHLSSLRRMG